MSKWDVLLVAGFLAMFVVVVSTIGRTPAVVEDTLEVVSPEPPMTDASQETLSAGTDPAESSTGLTEDDLWGEIQPRLERGYPWDLIVVHHSGASNGSAETIGRAKRRPHFVIGNGKGAPDGAVQPTELWHQQMPGSHTGAEHLERRAIGVTLVGDFSRVEASQLQQEAASRLIAELCSRFEIPRESVVAHRDLGVLATVCPGDGIHIEELIRGVGR